MSRRRHNNHFTNPCLAEMQRATGSSFEQVAQSLQLTPDQYASSRELRAWVRLHMRGKYVPPDLLASYGFKLGPEF
jgi:hypothetical protein